MTQFDVYATVKFSVEAENRVDAANVVDDLSDTEVGSRAKVVGASAIAITEHDDQS